MKYPKLRELKEAVKALLYGPVTHAFPKKPILAAPGFRGRPTPNEEKCIGCDACTLVCPANAIEIIDTDKTRTIIRKYDHCIFCGQCEQLCTTKEGVKLTQEYDLGTLNRKTARHEQTWDLLRCPDCNQAIGTKKHLLWVANQLGPMAYGNPPLIRVQEEEILGPETDPNAAHTIKRTKLFQILCPKCRHQVFLADEYGS